jgi:hypothetical protein
MEVYSANPSAPELPLGGFMPNDDPVQIRDIQGLGPVKAEISSTQSGTSRGEVPTGSSVGKRNIVLVLGLNPDWIDQTVSSLRQQLYAYFMPQIWCKLRFFSDDMPTVDIEGYTESVEPNIFSLDPEIQVSIICHKPDFIEADATSIEGVVDDGTTEYVFDYIGNVSTGFELRVVQTVDNPSYSGDLTLTVKSPEKPQVVEVEDITIDGTKYFKLSTIRGNKRVQNVAVADGTITNQLSKLTDDSVWPQLEPGENVITLAGAEPGQGWTLAYFNRFGGM